MSQAAKQRLIANRYAIGTVLRQGRAGVVLRATDVVDGAAVAIEEVETGVESEAERNARWSRIVRGARSAATLRHTGAVRLLDVLLDADHYFVVTELVEALPLSELIERHGQLPPRRVARIGLEVLDVLDAAHRAGFAHLDLQPANVLVAPDGAVRVAGFGLDAVPPASRPSPAQAPEQARGETAGPAADLWALGATMFEAVEGRRPFEDGAAALLYGDPRPPERAGPLAPLIGALLDKAPERRPAAAEARGRLRELAEGAATAGATSAGATSAGATSAGASSARASSAGAASVGAATAAIPRVSDAATSVFPAAPGADGGTVAAVGRAARSAAAGRAARVKAGARRAAPGLRTAVDWLLDPTRRGMVVGVGSVALALLSFTLIVLLIGNPAGSGSQARATAPPLTTAAPVITVAATTTTPPTSAAPATPPGWTVYADQATGFRIAYPASWEVVSPDDHTVEFHDRSVPTFLRVRSAPAPVPDPMAAQVQSSQQHAGFHQGSYQQTRLEPSDFQGRPGALLEFTFLGDDQQPFRAAELGTNTPQGPSGPGYWITIFVESHEVDWGVAQSLLQTALASFVPSPS